MNKEQYITSQLNTIRPKLSKKSIRIAFIGSSSLMQFSFFDFLKEHHFCIALVICFESDYFKTNQFLQENGYCHTKVFSISDRFKKKKTFSKEIYSNLVAVCNVLNVSHFILSPFCENCHLFSEFILKENYPMLFCSNSFDFSHLLPFTKEYKKIMTHSSSRFFIMNSYDFHLGYQYIKNLLKETINTYRIPVTYFGINSVLANTNLLESTRMHYFYLLNDIIKMNANLFDDQRIRKSKIFDQRLSINKNEHYLNDSYAKVIQFYNKRKKVVSVADYRFEILSNHSANHFKEMSSIWIHIGSIMKIQIIIQEPSKFDIHIYRNPDLLSEKQEELIRLNDLYLREKSFSNHDVLEKSCLQYLKQFLYLTKKSNLKDFGYMIDLLDKNLKLKMQKQSYHFSEYFFDLANIKKFVVLEKSDEKKKLMKQFYKNYESFTAGVVMNEVLSSKKKEIYIYISNQNEIASMLFYKSFSSAFQADMYYLKLKGVLLRKNAKSLFQYCIQHIIV
ncbi:MAG: hypothetical protein HFI09_03010 [Bacilli bacterium]|nr:hypothetical protein [Bacilli bacterium]